MSDNIAVTPGTGATIAADDIGGVLHQRIKLSLGADGTANDAVAGSGVNGTGVQRITVATDDVVSTNLVTLGGTVTSSRCQVLNKTNGYKVTVSITRPSNTTAYAAGDVIGDTGGSAILTFASAGPSASYLRITGGRLGYNVASVPSGMTGMRLHLYNASPTAIADNAAFDLVSGDRSKYVGFIDLGAPQYFGSTLYTEAAQDKQVLLVGGTTLYGELQTLGAFTPSSADTLDITIMGVDA